jgi:hypothetical protein
METDELLQKFPELNRLQDVIAETDKIKKTLGEMEDTVNRLLSLNEKIVGLLGGEKVVDSSVAIAPDYVKDTTITG